jgi:bla regulator protein BlaR1
VLQGVVETVLFYHPAVWWISRQIRIERELCCDDAAVSICGSTLTYVRALTEVESCRPCHRDPALAASGGSLTRRISRLLGIASPSPRGGSAGLVAAAILIGVLVSHAQQPVVSALSLPAFEVASIRPSDPDTPLKIDFAPGGRLAISHATLRFLIKIAYDVGDDQILGGPAWLNSTRFDLQGKPPVPLSGDPLTMTKEQILLFHEPTRLRLQRLLSDRFRLELRKESKSMPVFALVPGRNGAKLKRSATEGNTEVSFAHGILTAKRMDMASLARFLSEGRVGRPVVDATDLKGKYDLRLEWEPDPALDPTQAGNQQTAAGAGISVFTAVQQQLGLRLDARTSPADALVVARAELPSAN